MQILDVELPDEQGARLERFASSVQKTAREATAQLIDEGLRHAEFPAVEFRNSQSGRQAYVVGSSLAVWEVVTVAESYEHDVERTSAHLHWPSSRIEQVLAYVRAYPEEIDRALRENRAVTRQELQTLLPNSHWV